MLMYGKTTHIELHNNPWFLLNRDVYKRQTYARKLAENMNHGYAIDARVPSVMIAGPANFPVGKKEKQNQARHSNMEEWRHIQGLLEKIQSTGMGGISADDPAAIEKLQDVYKRQVHVLSHDGLI